jgi:hypothetical protein
VEALDAVAEQLSAGAAEEALGRIRGVVQSFEDHLVSVRRSDLVDAYMLQAIAQCQLGRAQRCREDFERVAVFRENAIYAMPRYPAEYLELFEEAREYVRNEAPRGSLEIIAYPEGAEVFVDGRSYGPSPAVAEGLAVGDHYVTVKAVGFERVEMKTAVSGRVQESFEVELIDARRALFLETDLPKVRRELGEARAGRFILGMRGAGVTANQIVFGVLQGGTGSVVEVTLYLYDMRTENLLSRVSETLDVNVDAARELATRLYHDVDLSGHLAVPDEGDDDEGRSTIWEKWWFWTAVGVVAASGVAAAVFLGREQQGQVPDGWIRFEGRIR